MDKAKAIHDGKTFLGIELGSTRIKAVLIDAGHAPLASGNFDWENQLQDGVWTYSLEDVREGVRGSFRALSQEVERRYGEPLVSVGALGVSAMMHGYLAFDADGTLLAPFRTWRNTMTAQAAERLTNLFGFNIPQRWSIAHLYQAMLNKEAHLGRLAFLTTLAGYVHFQLSGEKVLGIGDASGMFPIDSASLDYNAKMMKDFDALAAKDNYKWKLNDILPKVLRAGENAGSLTQAGAAFLDPSGLFNAGIPLCPPEGDAGTGMTATCSIAERTGNVSAGTSIFAMIVLEKDLSQVYPEIDIVSTPEGKPAAMVHCNNGTTDLDAWFKVLGEVASLFGANIKKSALYDALYNAALSVNGDCGGMTAYNYFAGEPITGIEKGRPLFIRAPESNFTLANFLRTLLFSTLGTLKIGMNILFEKEQVKLDKLLGHGGFFKTKEAGQRMVAAALGVPAAVMESAGEGGAWGIAILAAYRAQKQDGESLAQYIQTRVFAGNAAECVTSTQEERAGFASFMERYQKYLVVEKAASEV